MTIEQTKNQPTALVVEDERDYAELLATVLEEGGFSVEYAVDGFALGRALSLWIYRVAIEFDLANDDRNEGIWKRATELADSVALLESHPVGQVVAVGFYAKKGDV